MRWIFAPLYAGGFVFVMLLGLAMLGFTIWMLVDAIRRPESDFNPPASRMWWIIGLAVGLVLGMVGLVIAIIYFFAVRKPLLEGKTPPALFTPAPAATSPVAASRRHCPNCGHEIGTHARFCQNCGTAIGED